MPGFYKEGEVEIAGFALGVVEEEIVNGSSILPGDKMIGLASQGLHSNGYSLARKVLFEEMKLSVHDEVTGLDAPLGKELLRPTRIYVKTIRSLLQSFEIKGMAHITGGGMPGNIQRIVPSGCKAVIQKGRWEVPPIFKLIEKGGVPEEEMWRTFNNGVGMVIVTRSEHAEKISAEARKMGEEAFLVGEIVVGEGVEIV